jgi:hypothetical protein
MITREQSRRLAEIRAQLLLWESGRDISQWESTFLIQLLDQKDIEIARLRRALTLEMLIKGR